MRHLSAENRLSMKSNRLQPNLSFRLMTEMRNFEIASKDGGLIHGWFTPYILQVWKFFILMNTMIIGDEWDKRLVAYAVWSKLHSRSASAGSHMSILWSVILTVCSLHTPVTGLKWLSHISTVSQQPQILIIVWVPKPHSRSDDAIAPDLFA